MFKHKKTLTLLVIPLALFLLTLATFPVRAGGTVGDGTPASCTDAALLAALNGGGTITFDCGPNPHTIIASTYVIATDTIIDGGGLITLSGEDLRQVFIVGSGVSLTLDNLSVANGGWPGHGGAIANHGSLTLNNSIVRDSYSFSGYGGGIYNTGTLLVNNSQILNNGTGPGRAGGGIDNNNGTVTILNSTVSGNSSPYGGGVDSVGTLTIEGSTISGNSATVALGGGLDVGGTIQINNSVIESNFAKLGGGGINATTAGNMTITDSAIVNNEADAFAGFTTGGGILNAGRLTLTGVTLQDNRAYNGGGLYNNGSLAVTIQDSTLAGNEAAGGDGGGIYLYPGALTLRNSTLNGNIAAVDGGGLFATTGAAQLTNVTLYANSATSGGGLYKGDGATLTLANTIIAHNNGADCGLQNPLTSSGYNLTSDGSCGLSSTGDLENSDPLLAPLANNGGATFTQRPLPGSPAIDVVPAANCPATDQRGLFRPQGVACDVGAVEVEADGIPLACGGVFAPSADTTLDESDPGANWGQEPELYVYSDGLSRQYPLLAFDLSNALPPGATILKAELELSLLSTPISSTYWLTSSEVISPWLESAATWNNAPALGADYGPTAYHAQSGVLRVDVTSLVARWASQTISQTGLALRPAGDAPISLAFASREANSNPSTSPRLVIHCRPPLPAPVFDPTAADQAQLAGIQYLEQSSSQPVTLRLNGDGLAFASFRIPIPAGVGDDPLAKAEWFLAEYRDLLRLGNPASELQLIRRTDDGLHLIFRQRHQGVPVFGAEIGVHLEGGDALSVSGTYLPHITKAATPLLTAAQAETLALAEAGSTAELVGDAQLRYFDQRLLGLETGQTRLAWQVPVTNRGDQHTYYIDADNGAILFSLGEIFEGFDLDLEDGNYHSPDFLCWSPIGTNDNIGVNDSPPESVNAWRSITAVNHYWAVASGFGRDSYDNDGAQIELNIHVAGQNASYNGGLCDQFFFSDGFTVLDVTGHEWTHAVDDSEGGLEYANQSGALDESFADIFGYLVDPANWLIGEGTPLARPPKAGVSGCSTTPALRDMSNPPCFDDPDHVNKNISGDRTGLRPAVNDPNEGNDKGWVHTNSGIHNKAAYLIINGGSFNGYTITGIGRVKGQWLFHNVLVNRLNSSSNFVNARDAAVQEAIELANRGAFNFSWGDVCSVRRAYAAVGIGWEDHNCDGIDDFLQPDIDRDGVPNGVDNCPFVYNPGNPQPNQDGDALGDACDNDIDGDNRDNNQDNCSWNYNPSQADRNGNNVGDACDDPDHDGVMDDRDNCRDISNPKQENQDGDRKGDLCDDDIDGDLWVNELDNCPVDWNNDQKDSTETALGLPKDNVGDRCDLCPEISSSDNRDIDEDGLANPCDDDDDGDGVLDDADNCPLVKNPGQFDTDQNGVGFECDPAERRAFGNLLKDYGLRYSVPLRHFRLPVPICPECVGNYLPHDFQSVINLQLPVAFQARVVDSSGTLVAKGIGTEFNQALNFNPAPFAITRQFGPLAAQYSSEAIAVADELAPDDTLYYLEIIPEPGTDLSQSYPITVTLTEGVEMYQVYMPTILGNSSSAMRSNAQATPAANLTIYKEKNDDQSKMDR